MKIDKKTVLKFIQYSANIKRKLVDLINSNLDLNSDDPDDSELYLSAYWGTFLNL